jgi:hypothetical protein
MPPMNELRAALTKIRDVAMMTCDTEKDLAFVVESIRHVFYENSDLLAQPVPAEGAQAEYERGVENTTKFYLEREDKQRERYDALYALKLGGNIFALDLQKRLEQVNESFKLIAAAIAPPVTAAPAEMCGNRFLMKGSHELHIPDSYSNEACELPKGHTGRHWCKDAKWGPVAAPRMGDEVFEQRAAEEDGQMVSICNLQRNSMTRNQAIEIARSCAKDKPQSYYAEPFQPHEWVIDAILLAAQPVPAEGAQARLRELQSEFAILSRACGNWREWPEGTVSKNVPDYAHDDWKAAARAILERDELRAAAPPVTAAPAWKVVNTCSRCANTHRCPIDCTPPSTPAPAEHTSPGGVSVPPHVFKQDYCPACQKSAAPPSTAAPAEPEREGIILHIDYKTAGEIGLFEYLTSKGFKSVKPAPPATPAK